MLSHVINLRKPQWFHGSSLIKRLKSESINRSINQSMVTWLRGQHTLQDREERRLKRRRSRSLLPKSLREISVDRGRVIPIHGLGNSQGLCHPVAPWLVPLEFPVSSTIRHTNPQHPYPLFSCPPSSLSARIQHTERRQGDRQLLPTSGQPHGQTPEIDACQEHATLLETGRCSGRRLMRRLLVS